MDEANKPDNRQLSLIPDGEFHPQEHSERMRQTSMTAFIQIKDEGLLSRARFKAYREIFVNGPMTGAEVDDALKKDGGRGHYHKRISELVRLGVVKEVGKRECKVTGRQAIIVDVTEGLPVPPPKKAPKPKDDEIRDAVSIMRRHWKDEEETGTAPPQGLMKTINWLEGMVKP